MPLAVGDRLGHYEAEDHQSEGSAECTWERLGGTVDIIAWGVVVLLGALITFGLAVAIRDLVSRR